MTNKIMKCVLRETTRRFQIRIAATIDAPSWFCSGEVLGALNALCDAIDLMHAPGDAHAATSEPGAELGELCMRYGFRRDQYSTLYTWLHAQLRELEARRNAERNVQEDGAKG